MTNHPIYITQTLIIINPHERKFKKQSPKKFRSNETKKSQHYFTLFCFQSAKRSLNTKTTCWLGNIDFELHNMPVTFGEFEKRETTHDVENFQFFFCTLSGEIFCYCDRVPKKRNVFVSWFRFSSFLFLRLCWHTGTDGEICVF